MLRTQSYSVCTDCYLTAAQGYVEGIAPSDQDAIDLCLNDLRIGHHADAHITTGTADAAEEYSTAECACCGSYTQGAREELIVMWPDEILTGREQFLSTMQLAHVACALWTGVCGLDTDAVENEYGHEADELDPALRTRLDKDCENFLRDNVADIDASEMTAEQCGHDLWLTRCGHGAGFWDRGYADGIGERLSAAAKVLGNVDLILGEDGRIYG